MLTPGARSGRNPGGQWVNLGMTGSNKPEVEQGYHVIAVEWGGLRSKTSHGVDDLLLWSGETNMMGNIPDAGRVLRVHSQKGA